MPVKPLRRAVGAERERDDFLWSAAESLLDLTLLVPDPIEFSLSSAYLGKPLYPRQGTVLKCMFLRTDLLTGYDYEVIAEWEWQWQQSGEEGTPPGLLDRMEACRAEGRRWFRDTLNISGRRSGKNHIGGIGGSYVTWHYLALGNPQYHYGIDQDKHLAMFVFAAKKEMAMRQQWADLATTILGAQCFRPYLTGVARVDELRLYTQFDRQRIADRHHEGVAIRDEDMASIEIMPKESTLVSARGPALFALVFDEMAHVTRQVARASAEQVWDCLDPSTPVLCTDLRWRAVGDLAPGDELIGVDEYPVDGNTRRKMRRSTVISTGRNRQKALRLTFDDGSSVVCSANHRWLKMNKSEAMWMKTGDTDADEEKSISDKVVTLHQDGYGVPSIARMVGVGEHKVRYVLARQGIKLPGGRHSQKSAKYPEIKSLLETGLSPRAIADETGVPYQTLIRWMREESENHSDRDPRRQHLAVGDRIWAVVDPWEEETSKEAGYLAGVYDGEGYIDRNPISQGKNKGKPNTNQGFRVGFVQADGVVNDRVAAGLSRFGFDPVVRLVTAEKRASSLGTKTMYTTNITGLANSLSFLGRIRPSRLLSYNHEMWEGKSFKGAGGFTNTKTIVAIDQLPEQELVDMQTSTGTFIAGGLISHNSATPALDQFHKDGWIYEPSSPEAKTGQFYANSVEAQRISDGSEGIPVGLPARPDIFVLQLASWEIYKDWEIAHTIPLRPGEPECYPRQRQAVQEYDDQMRRLERANPQKFNVERRSRWASVADAYLHAERVDAAFEPWPNEERQMNVPRDVGSMAFDYVMHIDPSKVGDNTGLCIAHAVKVQGDLLPHVITDVVGHWAPGDFVDNGMEIDYNSVLGEIIDLIGKFLPSEVSFDQGPSSGMMMQTLRTMLGRQRLPKQVRVLERTATMQSNWAVAETTKVALQMGCLHLIPDELLRNELLFLQLVKPQKVDHPTSGPVQSKDVFDALSQCVHALIGKDVARMMGDQFTEAGILPGAQGGFPLPVQAAPVRGDYQQYTTPVGQVAASMQSFQRGAAKARLRSGQRAPRRNW
jgi:transposase-like protein